MLGDNPFFGVSHQGPKKSIGYLASNNRFANARDVVITASSVGIDLFMVSTHSDTQDFLSLCGYGEDLKGLPDLCVLVPNVHDLNKSAASRGILNSIWSLVSTISWRDLLKPRMLCKKVLLKESNFSKISHIGLHNILVDLLLGLRAKFLLNMFCRIVRFCGYKAVIVTLNPSRVVELDIRCDVLCFYYNINGYNVSCDVNELLTTSGESASRRDMELWGMGILASGAVSYEELERDPLIAKFDRIIIASSRP